MTLTLQYHPERAKEWESGVQTLLSHAVASRLAAGDSSLWGPQAQAEAKIRLGWLENPSDALPLVAEVRELRAELASAGVTTVVLCGMGGSSLAPEVMAKCDRVPLDVVDSTHPDQVARALAHDPAGCVVVVSSKSGSTIETAAARAVWEATFAQHGLDPRSRIIVVTDPGSPLEGDARAAGYRVFPANPLVGGRFSALTAFGLVPATLAGVDTARGLQEAAELYPLLREDSSENPALRLAAALATQRDIALLLPSANLPGLGDWIEQLVAESTGKDARGVLPVVVASADPSERALGLEDVVVVDLSGARPEDSGADVSVTGGLGAQFVLWEYATAMLGYLLQLNPFDQPDVESAKVAARGLLDTPPAPRAPDFSESGIDVWCHEGLAAETRSVVEVWRSLLASVGPSGYLAVALYSDRGAELDALGFRDALAARVGRPVTVGFGPRFLHSTGQFHKGGIPDGVFVQIEVPAQTELAIPGFPFDFGRLIDAQSAGDRAVLTQRGRPVLTLRLTERGDLSSLLDLLVSAA